MLSRDELYNLSQKEKISVSNEEYAVLLCLASSLLEIPMKLKEDFPSSYRYSESLSQLICLIFEIYNREHEDSGLLEIMNNWINDESKH